jgi:hypothetical protein
VAHADVPPPADPPPVADNILHVPPEHNPNAVDPSSATFVALPVPLTTANSHANGPPPDGNDNIADNVAVISKQQFDEPVASNMSTYVCCKEPKLGETADTVPGEVLTAKQVFELLDELELDDELEDELLELLELDDELEDELEDELLELDEELEEEQGQVALAASPGNPGAAGMAAPWGTYLIYNAVQVLKIL